MIFDFPAKPSQARFEIILLLVVSDIERSHRNCVSCTIKTYSYLTNVVKKSIIVIV